MTPLPSPLPGWSGFAGAGGIPDDSRPSQRTGNHRAGRSGPARPLNTGRRDGTGGLILHMLLVAGIGAGTALAARAVAATDSTVNVPGAAAVAPGSTPFQVEETNERIVLRGDLLEAAIRKRGYVSGVEGGSFHDLRTGARDLGFGLQIQDWIMEPGSDAAYRDQLSGDLPYDFNNALHGRIPKRSIEGPQICTQARELTPTPIRGRDFVAIEQSWRYQIAAPGRQAGSEWKQTIVFPAGKRYFISADRVVSRNSGDAIFFRQDLPGHIKHHQGDTFSEVYLSYFGRIPASEFFRDFPPDEKFHYRRERDGVPRRMIRAYHIRNPESGADGAWLAGLTLNPPDTYEAWCHQRGYVCFIHEVGGRPVRAGESFGAAYVVGFFDSITEMEAVYDELRGHSALVVNQSGWRLIPSP